MLKGNYTAVFISIFIHLVLLSALILLSPSQPSRPKDRVKKPAIKSYLYRQSKAVAKVQEQATVAVIKKFPVKELKTQVISPVKKIKEKSAEVVKKAADGKEELPPNSSKKSQIKTGQKRPTASPLPSELPVRPVIRSSSLSSSPLSSHSSLARLRNSINQQLADDAFKEHSQVRSASIMHGAQIPVPHSEVKLTKEQADKKNTSSSHAASITKNDNGTCTIAREQILGSPVESSVSSFSCGESKFDKSFREHMKRVTDKFTNTR